MKRYKIMVTTIQGNTYFFCCWKMGERYHLRLVILQAESIFYMEDELPIITEHLQNNLERLQIKHFIVEEITAKSFNAKVRKVAYRA
jgi:hypothetical protein